MPAPESARNGAVSWGVWLRLWRLDFIHLCLYSSSFEAPPRALVGLCRPRNSQGLGNQNPCFQVPLPQSAPGRLEPTRGSGGLGPGPGLTTRPAARHAILFVDRLTFVTCFFCTATMMRFLLRVLMRSLTSLDFSDAEPSLHSRSQCADVPCCWTCVPATVLETWSRTPVQRCSAVLIRLGCHGCGALTNGLGRGSSVLSSVV